MKSTLSLAAVLAVFAGPVPAIADDDPPIELVRCDESMGTVAVIEGDARSWVDKELGSPVAVIEALARASGCFTPFDINTTGGADYIVSIVAGDQLQVTSATSLTSDRVATAAALAQNSGYRSGFGTAGDVAGMIPLAGAAINGLAGLAGIGKKRTVATGLTLIEATGTNLVAPEETAARYGEALTGGNPARDVGSVLADRAEHHIDNAKSVGSKVGCGIGNLFRSEDNDKDC